MKRSPLSLLLFGYGAAAAGATVIAVMGAGPMAAGLAFWIGGAIATLAAGVVVTALRSDAAAEPKSQEIESDDYARIVAAWEADRRGETAEVARRNAAAG
jgi:bifunctional ADP-heptose synthase (sugar kinase/adenylyltransferase)